jgi:glycosyltransferase involved in cell wall biosynthesis
MSPFFSIIIPVYNKGPHVQRAINSVLAQTYKDFELILINDASTDNSLEEIHKFNDPRIRLLHRDTPGPGGYAARNLGIKEAHADWIAFLDADDEWFTDHLSKMNELIEMFPAAKVFSCGWKEFDPARKKDFSADAYHAANVQRGKHYITFDQYLLSDIRGRRPICTSIACVSKVLLTAVEGFPAGKANRGGDVDTWLRCLVKAGGIAWSNHHGAIYYRDSVNMVTRNQLTLAEMERETVRNLLPSHGGKTAKLLKRFSNTRTINAWIQNHHIKGKKNFSLNDKLYYEVNLLKNCSFVLLSILPSSFVLSIQSLYRRFLK